MQLVGRRCISRLGVALFCVSGSIVLGTATLSCVQRVAIVFETILVDCEALVVVEAEGTAHSVK